MKSTTLFALFLLSAFTSNLPSATADFVVDIDGYPVRNGRSYYILPVIIASGGGIGVSQTGNETCPLTVVQSAPPMWFWPLGLPVTFSSPYKIPYISEGLPLELSFVSVILCAPPSPKWTIVEGQPEGWAVKLTGYNNTVQGWFAIKKHFLSYKLVFCPLSNDDNCGDIGIDIDDDGNRRLVVTKNPLLVRFKIFGTHHDAA